MSACNFASDAGLFSITANILIVDEHQNKVHCLVEDGVTKQHIPNICYCCLTVIVCILMRNILVSVGNKKARHSGGNESIKMGVDTMYINPTGTGHET